MTEKPPVSVPSDEELFEIEDNPADLDARSGRRRLWLAGYHARDAALDGLHPEALDKLYAAEKRVFELESTLEDQRQRSLERAQEYDGNMAELRAEKGLRIAELEAEVAELRKQSDEDDNACDVLWEILGKFAGSAESLKTAARRAVAEADAAPRRTPELTERVANLVLQRFYDGNNLMHDAARLTAGAILDLVFGKKVG